MNFKNIHIGSLIYQRTVECDINSDRISNFINCTEDEIIKMYNAKSLDAETLLKWSKLLEYDFFRIYSQHLILYAPPANPGNHPKKEKSALPVFRKNIYTKEMISFILEQIATGKKTRLQVMEDYKIPKATLYNWINKYHPKNENSNQE